MEVKEEHVKKEEEEEEAKRSQTRLSIPPMKEAQSKNKGGAPRNQPYAILNPPRQIAMQYSHERL